MKFLVRNIYQQNFRGFLMAFEPNYEKVVSSFRKKLGTSQTLVECKLPTEEGISKLLCSCAKCYIKDSSIEGNTINYFGVACFQVTYINQQSEVVGADYTVEFKEKYVYESDINGVPASTCNVVDVNSSVNNGELRVVATLEIENEIVTNESQVVLVGANDLLVRRELLSFNVLANKITDNFDVVYDYEIKDGISKVLTVCANPYLTKIVPNNNYLLVEGGVSVDISYLTDDNLLRTVQTSFNFSQEVSDDGVDELSVVQGNIDVVCNDLKVSTAIDVDSAVVSLTIPMMFTGFVFNKTTIDVVADAFSLTNYVNTTNESMTTFKGFEGYHFEDRVNGNLTIDDDMPNIDEVLGTCCNHVVLAGTSVNDGVFTVEGVAYTTILYQNKELNNINSVLIEMPFSITNNISETENDLVPVVQLALGDVTARVRRNKEIEVSADLHIYADFYKNMEEGVVSKITLDDEIPYDECALSIYISKEGDTVWDIAKELGVSPEVVLQQNPNLSDEIAPLTRVVVYKQRVQEF